MIEDGGGATRELARIERLAGRAETRIRIGRALQAGAIALCAGLTVAVVVLVLRKTGIIHREKVAYIWFAASGVATVAVAAIAYARRLPSRAGAVALDRFHGLSDRLASALSFGALPAAERTPFMDAAIDDAVERSAAVSPSKAVVIALPQALGLAAFLAVAFGAIGLFEVRHHEAIVSSSRTIDPVEVTPDDLDAMREFLKELEQREQSDETKAAIQEFNKLIDDLANKRLDRNEAFEKMEKLEERLMQSREEDKKALDESLSRLGDELKKSEPTKAAGDAIHDKDLAKAQDALHDLAKKLREGKVDKAKLDEIRAALKKAADAHADRMAELEKKKDEAEKDLLEKKQKLGDGGSDEERSLLDKKQKELERLEREQKQEEKAGRQLDRLDRELEQAAEDLAKDAGLSAQDLDNSAEELNRMAKEEMSEKEKQELRDRLRELRETLRQQGQGGKGQMARLRKFQGRARGQSGKGGEQQPGQGQKGQEGEGEEQGEEGKDGQGQEGQGQDGQGQQPGGKDGKGGKGQSWVLGPNGEKVMMLSKGQGQGQGQGDGQGQGQGQGQQGGNGGQGQGPPGSGWGEGHDPNVQGGATNPKMGTQDTQVQGQNAGSGPSRSQVIQGAAQRGFVGRGYKKVYTEYHNVAEESLNKDDLPGGYRFYVRRYFQLIRPRDGSDGSN
jgi:hypothetical protein